jgi:hypothetical protein
MHTLSKAVLLLLSSSALVYANITSDYSSVLHGHQALDQATIDSMYAQFQQEYESLAQAHY